VIYERLAKGQDALKDTTGSHLELFAEEGIGELTGFGLNSSFSYFLLSLGNPSIRYFIILITCLK